MAVDAACNPDPKFYTDITLQNRINDALTMFDRINWYGSGDPPVVIQARMLGKVKHDSCPFTGDSQGGVAYSFKGNIKLVVAWRNMNDESNKAYVDIIRGDEKVDWSAIESQLKSSCSKPDTVHKFKYVATVEIDPNGATPVMKATLKEY